VSSEESDQDWSHVSQLRRDEGRSLLLSEKTKKLTTTPELSSAPSGKVLMVPLALQQDGEPKHLARERKEKVRPQRALTPTPWGQPGII